MLSYVRNYFRDCRLARMSNGEYCLIRDQGPVKGGRGLRHHEKLIAFSIRGLAANIVSLRKQIESANAISFFGNALRRLVAG
jgi:hypothetical protein